MTKRKVCLTNQCNDSVTSSASDMSGVSSSCGTGSTGNTGPSGPPLTAEQVTNKYGNAVVEICSEFVLLGQTNQAPFVPPIIPITTVINQPIAVNQRVDIFLNGNGFLIKGDYIVTPAQLVLMPPSLSSVVNRYPLFGTNQSLGVMKNQMIRASRILVSVFNVNNDGHAFVYEADLVGVDGAGDIAVLRINYRRPSNMCNPVIGKTHPVLKFGSSRKANDGDDVYLLGSVGSTTSINNRSLNQSRTFAFNSVASITKGTLADHRYVDFSGWMLPECVLVTAPGQSTNPGLPIVDVYGNVIGMQTTDLQDALTYGSPALALVAGPSEFFMRRVIKNLISGINNCKQQFNCYIELISDPAGSYYRYKKAYAGLGYHVATDIRYATTYDFESDPYPAGAFRALIDANGNFVKLPSCTELIGLIVVGLAGLNPLCAPSVDNGIYFVPGGPVPALANLPLCPDLPTSSFLAPAPGILPGDIITHVEGVPLGGLEKQVALSLITWRLWAGKEIEVNYRRGGNVPSAAPSNDITENYETLYTGSYILSDFPYLMDYPWYAVGIFSNLSVTGWAFPGNQITTIQYPSLNIGQISFQPAL